MTEDPVKLYVAVMAILLAVLTFVAITSYNRAEAIQSAIDRAPAAAKRIREYGADIQQLCRQLTQGSGGSRAGRKATTIITEAARKNGVVESSFTGPKSHHVPGSQAKERQYTYSFGRGETSPKLTRDQIARFCYDVELYSSGIYKTISIRLNRDIRENPAGKEEVVTNDKYSGEIIFGNRYVGGD